MLVFWTAMALLLAAAFFMPTPGKLARALNRSLVLVCLAGAALAVPGVVTMGH